MDKTRETPSLPQLRRHPRLAPLSGNAKILLMVALHVVLALLMRASSLLATLHALAVFALGAWTVLREDDLKKLIPIAGYIIGAEVLWRMTDAGVFWEFGKYALVALFTLALLKKGKIQKAGLPILFFVVLTPSIILTVDALGFSGRAREFISFNLSGPLAVSACLVFFSQVKVSVAEIKNWVWPMVYPILGILTLAVYSTLTAESIYFGTESVFATSGGFGPNQVSAALGLGALMLILYALTEGRGGRGLALLFSLLLLTQSFLTFSRGGVYNFAIGLAAALLHLLRKPNRFIRAVFIALVVVSIAGLFIIPRLESLTGGMLVQRFTDLDLASRESLVEADIKLFRQNPLLGVGPGMGYFMRPGVRVASAHTEYSRLLSEHGTMGILSMLILAFLLLRSYVNAPDAVTRAWMVGLAAWPLVEMAHAAMRVAAIAFTLGMAVMAWQPSRDDQEKESKNLKPVGWQQK